MKKVWLYKKVNDKIVCEACKHFCTLKEGEWGKCGVRVNKNQELYLSVYNKASSLNIDPIEKKPLFHFLPSSSSLSIGTVGCNFGCDFCQNYSTSQYPKENNHRVFGKEVDAVTLIDIAKEYQVKSISYTYKICYSSISIEQVFQWLFLRFLRFLHRKYSGDLSFRESCVFCIF